jgi:hypothetical protein
MTQSSATIMTGSNFSYDTDLCECKQSDDDNLENLRRKVSSFITDTASSNSSNTTVINKKYNTKASDETRKHSNFENNNDIEDSDDEFYEKKFNYSARIKRFVAFKMTNCKVY